MTDRIPSEQLRVAARFIWHFSKLQGVVGLARARANRFAHDFLDDEVTSLTVRACSIFYDVSPAEAVLVILTKDLNAERGDPGWWNVPEFARCWHLSLSRRSLPADVPIAADLEANGAIVRAFFPDHAGMTWVEPATTEGGADREVWHYRLFCNRDWQPINVDSAQAKWERLP